MFSEKIIDKSTSFIVELTPKDETNDVRTQEIKDALTFNLHLFEKILQSVASRVFYSLNPLHEVPGTEVGELHFKLISSSVPIRLQCQYVRTSHYKSRYERKIIEAEERYFGEIEQIKLQFYRESNALINDLLRPEGYKKGLPHKVFNYLQNSPELMNVQPENPLIAFVKSRYRDMISILILILAILIFALNISQSMSSDSNELKELVYNQNLRIDSLQTINQKADEILNTTRRSLEYYLQNEK